MVIPSIVAGMFFLYTQLLYPRCSIIGPQIEVPLQSCSDDNYTMPNNLELRRSCLNEDVGYAQITNEVLSLGDLTVGASTCAETILGQHIISNTMEIGGQLYGDAYNDLNDYTILTKNRCIAGGMATEYVITPTYVATNFASNIAVSATGDIIAVKNVCVTPPRVEMYRREVSTTGTTYTLVQEIFAPGIGCSDLNFGTPFSSTLALSADGSILFIGSPFETPTRVSIYIYDTTLGSWNFAQTITSTDEFFGSFLGCSLTGEYFVTYSLRNSSIGHAYVFRRIPADPCTDMLFTNSWALQQDLIPTTTNNVLSASYGYVAISPDGTYIATSDPFSGDGKIWIFTQNGTSWQTLQELAVLGALRLGDSVSLSANAEYLIATESFGFSEQYFFVKNFGDTWQLAQKSRFIRSPLSNVRVAQSADGSCVAIASVGGSASGAEVVLVGRRDNRWAKVQTLAIECNTPALSADGSTLALPFFDLSNSKVTILETGCNAVQSQLVVTGSVCMEQLVTVTARLSIGGSLYAGGSIAAGVTSACSICPSDRRIKDMIQDAESERSLELIQALKPVTFAWKYPECHPELGSKPAGFIAQQLPAAVAHWRTNYRTVGAERTEGDTFAAIALRSDSITHLIAAVIALDAAHTSIEQKLKP